MLCSHCKKNTAVVIVTKIENNQTTNEGLCIPCAQKLGIDMSKSLQALNFNPDDFENLTSQIGDMLNLPDDIEMPDSEQIQDFFNIMGQNGEAETPPDDKSPKKSKKKKRLLDTYGTNLTKNAADGEVDIVVGRESEITRCIEILNRRTKNNPCLIGEPGLAPTRAIPIPTAMA